MKKNYLTKIVYFLSSMVTICLLFTLSGCEKSEIINRVEKRFEVKKGIVHFKSFEDFNLTIKEIKGFNDIELEEWEKKNGIETSMRKFQNGLIDNNENSMPSQWIIPDQVFAAIVNSDGKFVLADSMHLITFDKEFVYKVGEDIDIQQIESNSKVKVHVLNNSETKNWSDKIYYFNHLNFDIPPSSARGTLRVILYGWSKTWLAYCSNGVGIKCEYRDKNWLGQLYWRSAKLDNVNLCGESQYYINGTFYRQANCDSGTNPSDEDCYVGQGMGVINTDWIIGTFNFKYNNTWPTYYCDAVWQ